MWRKVATLADVWSGEMLGLCVDGRRLLLVRVGEALRAYEDRCAHQGVELSRGRLEGRVLTCSAHEWQYDVVTGESINPSGMTLRPLPLELREGEIHVDL
jgi:toluene monooxygenase system ferredoxin subunit